MIRNTAIITALGAVGALALGGCGSSGSSSTTPSPASTPATTAQPAAATPSGAPQASAKVDIANFKFTPQGIVVKAGGKITFLNSDSAQHTATDQGATAAFDTKTLQQGQSRSVTISKPGTYHYACLFHAFMTGTITVK